MEILDLSQAYMKKAFDLAQQAFEEDEVPIGAIVVCENKIIGKGYNQTEKLKDVTAHAEILAITAAAANINSKYLTNCEMYVTIEPCLMCLGAIKNSHISKLYIGAEEPKTGYSRYIDLTNFYPKLEVYPQQMAHECQDLMKEFFKSKR